MKIRKFLLYFSIILFLLSCSGKQKESIQFNNAQYIINLDEAKEISIPYSTILKNVRTIILETNKDCMIGTVTEFQVFDGYIYILDASIAKSMFVFSIDGKFIRKIGRLGNGPGEYISVKDFTIDTENRFIFLQDQGTLVHKYKLDGTFVNSVRIQEPRSNSYFIQSYNGRLFSSIKTWEVQQDDYMLLEVDPEDGKILSRSLPVKYNKGWIKPHFTENFFKSRLNNPPRYSQLFMDYIMSLDKGITPFIELKSKNLVTENDIRNLPDGKNLMENLMPFQGTSKIWDVHCFIESDAFILFKYKSGFFDSFTVVFHKETGSVKIAKNFTNDLILRQHNDINPAITGIFKFSDKKGAYEIVPPFMIKTFLKSIKNNEIVPNMDKIDQLIQLDIETNPVIFFYEFK